MYIGSADHNVYAFDAAGTTNCTGTPKTCQPLWTANPGASLYPPTSSLAITNGIVYQGSSGRPDAYDAAGP